MASRMNWISPSLGCGRSVISLLLSARAHSASNVYQQLCPGPAWQIFMLPPFLH